MTHHDGPSLRHDTAETFLRVWGQVVQYMGPNSTDSEPSITMGRSFNQLRLIRELRNGPLTMSQIAHLLGVTNAAVTGIADRLEQSGLVQRFQDATDRRVVSVRLTPAGDAVQGNNHQRAVEWTREVLSKLDPEEMATFGALLAKMEAGIVQTGTPLAVAKGPATTGSDLDDHQSPRSGQKQDQRIDDRATKRLEYEREVAR